MERATIQLPPKPMRVLNLEDIDLLEIGNSITMHGALYQGGDTTYIVPFPDVCSTNIVSDDLVLLEMSGTEWERFLYQSDVLDTRGPNKAVLRKSQRVIDRSIQWEVFRRDKYACRYCGRDTVPLTVDHIITWEEGGASTTDNLLASCGPCNKRRGMTDYITWLNSPGYAKVSTNLDEYKRDDNLQVVQNLDYLRGIKTKIRSR